MPALRPHRYLPTVALAASLLGASAAAAQNYLPLEVGNRWIYVTPGGGREVLTVTGTLMLRGRLVSVISFSGHAPNEGLDNYWISGNDGFLLCGFLRNVEKFGVAYDPPIRFLRSPANVGDISTTMTTTYSWPDWQVPDQSFTIRMQVIEDVRLDLPIGSMEALGIGQSVPLNGMRAYGPYSVDGKAASDGPFDPVPRDWYAAGLGDVQYHTDDLYQLQDFEIPTPVAATTWGRLKRLYR